MLEAAADPDANANPGHRPGRWTFGDLGWLLAVSLIATALRLLWIQQWSFDHDEAITWRLLTLPGELLQEDAVEGRRLYPLVYLLERWLVDQGYLRGMTEGWLRLPFAFAGCLLAPLLAILGRPLVGRGAARLAALVVALHPLHLAASQTAEPTVFAVTIATFAGVLAVRRWSFCSLLLVILAGACQPIGWLVGVGMWLLGWRDRLRWTAPSFVLLGVVAAVLLPLLGATSGLTTLVLVAVAIAFGNHDHRCLAIAALLPLAGGGIWWWFEARGGTYGLIASLPALLLVAAAGAVHCYEGVKAAFAQHVRIGPVAGAAASLMWLGELANAVFLYFIVFAGGRSPWRDVAYAAAADRQPGGELVVLAASGVESLRVYLRPNHWRDLEHDLHPGIRIEPLSGDASRLAEQLQEPAVLVLQHHELRALEGAPELGELLQDFAVNSVWASPRPFANDSLYLLRRRVGE